MNRLYFCITILGLLTSFYDFVAAEDISSADCSPVFAEVNANNIDIKINCGKNDAGGSGAYDIIIEDGGTVSSLGMEEPYAVAACIGREELSIFNNTGKLIKLAYAPDATSFDDGMILIVKPSSWVKLPVVEPAEIEIDPVSQETEAEVWVIVDFTDLENKIRIAEITAQKC